MSVKQDDLYDILIVGSGPAGAQAAKSLVQSGLKIALMDIGHIDSFYVSRIPNRPFSEIRESDENQALYFLGENKESVLQQQKRAGAHLTPPRQHMVKDSENLFPTQNQGFFALLATSRGGLGTSWGANCFTYSDIQLKNAGLDPNEIRPYYEQVAKDIGISADSHSDLAPHISQFAASQEALDLDDNASTIYHRYQRRRDRFSKFDVSMGPSPLASLTADMQERRKNPYFDMDFWSDNNKSVYRPQFTIDELCSHPNFTYLPERLAISFSDLETHVELKVENIKSNKIETLNCKKLLVAAGAINSLRLVANSLRVYDKDFPILCNPNYWVAGINLSMLGKKAKDRRHSLSQLTALLGTKNDHEREIVAQFYSYRSLLLFRLVKDLPLPHFLSITIMRLLLTSLVLINVHFPAPRKPRKSVRVKDNQRQGEVQVHYDLDAETQADVKRGTQKVLQMLLKLRIFPLKIEKPENGASIHYAGTLPANDDQSPCRCDKNGCLEGAKNVYVIDSSTWTSLPARGLTLTIMANARRIAQFVAGEIKR